MDLAKICFENQRPERLQTRNCQAGFPGGALSSAHGTDRGFGDYFDKISRNAGDKPRGDERAERGRAGAKIKPLSAQAPNVRLAGKTTESRRADKADMGANKPGHEPKVKSADERPAMEGSSANGTDNGEKIEKSGAAGTCENTGACDKSDDKNGKIEVDAARPEDAAGINAADSPHMGVISAMAVAVTVAAAVLTGTPVLADANAAQIQPEGVEYSAQTAEIPASRGNPALDANVVEMARAYAKAQGENAAPAVNAAEMAYYGTDAANGSAVSESNAIQLKAAGVAPAVLAASAGQSGGAAPSEEPGEVPADRQSFDDRALFIRADGGPGPDAPLRAGAKPDEAGIGQELAQKDAQQQPGIGVNSNAAAAAFSVTEHASEISKPEATQAVNTADVISQIMEKLKAEVTGRVSEVRISLKPENLGEVTLKVATDNGIVTAQFLAEDQRVREILEANFSRLRDALGQQGLQVSQLAASINPDGKNGQTSQFTREQRDAQARERTRRIGAAEAVSGAVFAADAGSIRETPEIAASGAAEETDGVDFLA
ncbi:MAG: flagellar hook-length control protein FliK [Defluviitaleaceae bacterium]|nr:flagellar hook-length control protein FliK [Defluviitaleaceae bacterium]